VERNIQERGVKSRGRPPRAPSGPRESGGSEGESRPTESEVLDFAMAQAKRQSRKEWRRLPYEARAVYSVEDLEGEFLLRFFEKRHLLRFDRDYQHAWKGYIWYVYHSVATQKCRLFGDGRRPEEQESWSWGHDYTAGRVVVGEERVAPRKSDDFDAPRVRLVDPDTPQSILEREADMAEKEQILVEEITRLAGAVGVEVDDESPKATLEAVLERTMGKGEGAMSDEDYAALPEEDRRLLERMAEAWDSDSINVIRARPRNKGVTAAIKDIAETLKKRHPEAEIPPRKVLDELRARGFVFREASMYSRVLQVLKAEGYYTPRSTSAHGYIRQVFSVEDGITSPKAVGIKLNEMRASGVPVPQISASYLRQALCKVRAEVGVDAATARRAAGLPVRGEKTAAAEESAGADDSNPAEEESGAADSGDADGGDAADASLYASTKQKEGTAWISAWGASYSASRTRGGRTPTRFSPRTAFSASTVSSG